MLETVVYAELNGEWHV